MSPCFGDGSRNVVYRTLTVCLCLTSYFSAPGQIWFHIPKGCVQDLAWQWPLACQVLRCGSILLQPFVWLHPLCPYSPIKGGACVAQNGCICLIIHCYAQAESLTYWPCHSGQILWSCWTAVPLKSSRGLCLCLQNKSYNIVLFKKNVILTNDWWTPSRNSNSVRTFNC